MIKPYKNKEAGKKEQIREMFDDIAPRYDLLNHVLSMGIDRRWRKKLVKKATGFRPATILDVATGTGDLAIALARRNPRATVTGFDLSPQMLEIGRRKAEKAGLKIEFLEGDAENLPFDDNSFDAVSAAFGVRNFENLEAGIAQMHRVLSPGGRIYILEFSMPDSSHPLGGLYRFYFSKILPAIGKMVSGNGDAYRYLPASVGEFPYGTRFALLLENTGFHDIELKTFMGGIATLYTAVKP